MDHHWLLALLPIWAVALGAYGLSRPDFPSDGAARGIMGVSALLGTAYGSAAGMAGPRADALLMRAAGDSRRDSIVKREIFDARIRDVWQVKGVLDDRDQVVRMWRALGLTCVQVAPGDF